MISFGGGSEDRQKKKEARNLSFASVKSWATTRAEAVLPPELEPMVTIQEIQCLDPKCPDTLETFVTVFWRNGGSWKAKLGKELVQVAEEDVDAAFRSLRLPSAEDEANAGDAQSASDTPAGQRFGPNHIQGAEDASTGLGGPYKCPCCSGEPLEDPRSLGPGETGWTENVGWQDFQG